MRIQCTGQILKLEIELSNGRVWPFAFNAIAAAELERIHPGALQAAQEAQHNRDIAGGVGIFYDVLAAGIRAGLIMERRSDQISMEEVYSIPLSDGLFNGIYQAMEAFAGANPTNPPKMGEQKRRNRRKRKSGR